MVLLADKAAAATALSVGMAYVQMMGTPESEVTSVAGDTRCLTVKTAIVDSTNCREHSPKVTGWRVRFRYQFLSEEQAKPRLAPEVPVELRPAEAMMLMKVSTRELAALDE
jgi:hypothetical protein